ncbi:MAG TPA: glycosyltransferase [Terriglobales bacterium]|nr:glycosyltransferase [Terriglobales bacterium]
MSADSKQRTLLFYCQHALGMGHLMRSLALAEGLQKRFHVALLSGGRLPACARIPSGIELIELPPLAMDLGMRLVTDGEKLEDAQLRRKAIILETYRKLAADVVLIELFPFGRKKFSGELLPLLEEARNSLQRPLIGCSLRDILVSRKQEHDDTAVERANQFFDVVLVHSDPTFARLEETFHPEIPLQVPVHYTGFVSPEQELPLRHERNRKIVVSAGGGLVGEPLMRTAIEAFPQLHQSHALEMKVIAGPFLPEDAWKRLSKMAEGKTGLALERSVPDLYSELCQAAVSVSQCGYNTAMDLLRSQVPALVVPFDQGKETEQTNRARKLEARGLLRVLEQKELTPERLALGICATVEFQPREATLDLNGATASAEILEKLLSQHRSQILVPHSSAWRSEAKNAGMA